MPIRPLHFVKWLTLAVFALLLCLSGYYFYHQGFGRHWRALLSKEFQRFGFQIRVRRLTLDPLRGLVAKDIEIYESDRRQTVVAQISDLSLDINYANLLQQEPALNAVDLHDAKIAIPVDPLYPRRERIRITQFQSRIYFFPGRIEVRQASGMIYGLRLQTSGTLINPAAFRLVPSPEIVARPAANAPRSFVQLLVKEFEALRFSEETPRLNFTFQVDLAHPESIRLEDGRLFAGAFTRNGYQLRNLDCQFSIDNQRLDLQRLFLRDALGEFFAKGSWNLATGEKIFQARSGLNLAGILANDPKVPWAKEIKLDGPSEIEVSGSAHPDGRLQFLGKLNFDQFSVRTVEFQGMKAEFSKSGESWMITNAQLTHRSGTLSADLLHLPGNFRIRVYSALNPTEILPLLPPRAQHVLAEWQFETSPLIQATLSGATPEFAGLSGNGQFWLGKTKLRGALLNSASASFVLKEKVARCDQVQVNRDEGVGSGALTYDFGQDALTVDHFQANLYPEAFAAWVDPAAAKSVQPLHFTKPPNISATGTVQYRQSSRNDLRLRIESQASFAYVFDKWEIPFDNGSGEFAVMSDRIELRHFEGEIGFGRWSMQSEFALPLGSNRGRSTSVRFENVNLQTLTKKIDFFKDYQGQASGSLDFQTGNDLGTGFSARGTLDVRDAKVSKTRLFATLMTRLEPLEIREPLQINLTFQLTREELKLSSLQLLSEVRAVRLSGSLDFLGGLVDLAGNLDGGAMRIRGFGTINQPVWELSPAIQR
jgi:hypothetical protein